MSGIADFIDRLVRGILALLFAGLIAVVAFQIAARNILLISAPWSLDVAQLLFSWCIFLGAGLAFRYREHYTVNLWPAHSPLDIIPGIAAFLASVAVIFVLIRHGIAMSGIGLNRLSLSLNISEFWFYLPIPVCGFLMALFQFEKLTKGELE